MSLITGGGDFDPWRMMSDHDKASAEIIRGLHEHINAYRRRVSKRDAEITRLRAEVETMRNAAIHWHDERDTIEHSSIERCAEVCVQRALMHQSRGHTGGYHMPAAQMEAVQCAAAIRALKEGDR